jgi:lipopolysaccharide transport system permease protein
VDLIGNLFRHRTLIWQFTWRDIRARYQGSYLGLCWSLLLPLAMLAAYTFVFRFVFQARWGVRSEESALEFGLTLFAGLLVFNVFGETGSRAPALILGHPNFVKRVIFPLEILPVTSVAATLVHVGASLVVVVAAAVLLMAGVGWQALWVPFIAIPYVCLVLGLSWFLASLGVFLRDLGPMMVVAVQFLVFLTPVFYPLALVPEPWRTVMSLNPLAVFVDSSRRVLLWNQPPDLPALGAATICSLVVLQTGYIWFMKSKRAFADVV